MRETQTTRLIFRPLLLDNINDKEASVKGNFIFQRKRKSDSWEDVKDLNLSQLKANEWVKIELKSAELLHFFQSLATLYEIYRREGIPSGITEYVPIDVGLGTLLAVSQGDLTNLLNQEPDSGSKLLSRLLRWCGQVGLSEQVVQQLENLEPENLQELSVIAGLTALKASLKIWDENKNNASEEFWQETFLNHAFVLSQIFAYPVVIVKDKAFLGGKDLGNVGGNIVDFLAKNNISENAVLIEIKTPQTRLLHSQYRDNAYSISSDLSGSIVQVLNYRRSLISNFASLQSNNQYELESFEPICLIIAGTHQSELTNPTKKRSFELFRSHLQGVQVITYDELFEKVRLMIELLEGKREEVNTNIHEEADLPF
ncbi:MAG TPA: DUF4263 domain-containing protein [Chloroflexota bacterium]|nr:DUF4263 domain-containing protein [Chloroflexota bacterium]